MRRDYHAIGCETVWSIVLSVQLIASTYSVKDYLAHTPTNVVGDMCAQMDPHAPALAKANAGLKEASSRYFLCAI